MKTLSWTLLLVAGLVAAAPASRLAVEAASPEVAATRQTREVTLPVGTRLRVRLDTSHNSDTSRVEDQVRAHLVAPVVLNGRTVVPADSELTGHVVSVRPSGKVKGRGYLAVRFSELRSGYGNERYDIVTRTWAREAAATKMKDAGKIALPAGVGAAVGAVVGGKKGAVIGTGVGAAAGTGVVLATSGKEVNLPRGATLILRLSSPLRVRLDS